MAAPTPIMMPDHSHFQADMLLNSKVADTRADLLSAGAANTQTVLTDANANVSTLLQEGCGQTASIIAATERQSYALESQADRNTHAKIAQADRIAHAGGAQVERNFAETRGTLNANFSASLLAAKDGEIATHKGVGDLKHLICESTGKLAQESSTNREALAGLIGREALQSQLQAANNFGAIQLESAKNFAAQRLENDKQFALASMAACQNKEALARQLADCCCDIKAAVNMTANATQALIQSTESARIRDALAASTNENLILRLGGVAAVSR